VKPPDPLFAASRLQQSEIDAGVKLQKWSLGISDLSATPEKVKIGYGKVIEKSLNFIVEYLYEPCIVHI